MADFKQPIYLIRGGFSPLRGLGDDLPYTSINPYVDPATGKVYPLSLQGSTVQSSGMDWANMPWWIWALGGLAVASFLIPAKR
jgi:hypothetical protein